MTHATSPLTIPQADPYWEQFERLKEIEMDRAPLWIQSIRNAGMAYFAELGFPTARHEDWKYTSVAPIQRMPFKPALGLPGFRLTAEEIERFFIKDLSCHRLVFIDGHFSASLSAIGLEESLITAESMAEAIGRESLPIEQHLARYAQPSENAFVALNTGFFQDGAFILIPPHMKLPEPVHLIFISSAMEDGVVTHPRNLVLAGKHSQATIIESYVHWGGAGSLTNAVTELVLEEGALIEHCKLQDESHEAFHIATIQAQQGPRSRLISHSISTGGRLARNDIRSVLAGEGGHCLLNGLYLAKGEQLVDHHTLIDHACSHCESHEFYHGIIDGCAKGVFNGRIFVRRNAQKTDAKQTNRNLLLSDNATVDSKPQLEIFADDVKCTHGATVGQLDEESIFYMRSRGIGEAEARRMLIHAFARDIINRISVEPLRTQQDELVLDWFRQ